MRVVITHTDLRIYWPARISALQHALESRGDELYTVEIAGAGSPYAFRGGSGVMRNWICLFPTTKMEDIPASRASRELLAKLNELNPDVVMSGSFAYPSGAAALYWAKTNGKPVIIFDDVRQENVPRNPLVNYIKKLLYQQVDAILCPASPWTEGFVRWGLKQEQLFFGVDVVDNEFWSTSPSRRSAVPVPFLLAVGRQISAKNFIFLLHVYESYRAAAGQRNCLPLVLIGEGPERRMLESFIIARSLQGVQFFPFAHPKKLRTFYHHAAALILPSRSETWGLVVNEAMAAGLPVLVSNVCGCASVLVQEGVNGYTFAPNKPQQLLEALLSFTGKDPAAKAAMGKASKDIIRHWGLDQFVKGSLQAIAWSMSNRKIKRSIPAWIVLKNWKGRYRPV